MATLFLFVAASYLSFIYLFPYCQVSLNYKVIELLLPGDYQYYYLCFFYAIIYFTYLFFN